MSDLALIIPQEAQDAAQTALSIPERAKALSIMARVPAGASSSGPRRAGWGAAGAPAEGVEGIGVEWAKT